MTTRPRFTLRLPLSTFALALLCVLRIINPQIARAQSYNVIHTFTGLDGSYPTSTLVLDHAGNFYGTTEQGGPYNRGVLFQLKAAGSGWALHPLHDFGQQASYGFFPLNYGGLTFGPDDALYGTASDGGLGDCFHGQAYCGVVFQLLPPVTACKSALCPWNYTLVYQLTNDVEDPEGSLVFDAAGNLYGTTYYGTIYEISPSGGGWNESTIYQLDHDTNAGLVIDGAGNLYGVWADYASTGGVFELSPSSSGWTETMLYSFTGGSDGGTPEGGLVLDNAGNLYGSTSSGGSGGGGTVFELSPSGSGWTYKLLCSLQGFAQMSGPQSPLALDSQGNLYGATFTDGTFGEGSVFKATRTGNGWVCSDLYDFAEGSGGSYPIAGVTLDSQGVLYGTTSAGGISQSCNGSYGCGVVWEITP